MLAPNKPLSIATEMELLQMDLTRAARSIVEELGISCRGDSENDDGEVHTGEEPYETIEEYNEILSLGEALSRVPWGTNAKDHRSYYIAGTGHVMTVKPAESDSDVDPDAPEDKATKESIRRVSRFLKKWCKVNKWKTRQAEVSQRLDKHGEVFDMLYYDNDGYLKLTFAEPVDLMDDPDSLYQDAQDRSLPFFDSMGVRRTNDIRDKNVAYYIDNAWYDDLEYNSVPEAIANFPENKILVKHRKRNVTSLDRRGMTLYWPVREELKWAKKNLANLMRVSGFQAAFGAIRTISAMQSADAVKSYLSTSQTGTAGSGAAASETFDMPAPGVVTVPAAVKWEFPDTGKGNQNHIEVLVQLLRAAASGMKLPEFMLTANVGEGNFASTLVSEGPFHKAMQWEQSLMIQEDLEIIEQALWMAAEKGIEGITEADILAVMVEIKPPRVQTRNRKEDYEVNSDLWEKGQLSGKSLSASEDRDFDSEQKQIGIERPKEFPAPVAVSGPVAPPGPEPGLKADPLAEKGVMAGEPPAKPEK